MPDIHKYGEALFGYSWQTDMAHALGVSDRSVRLWVQNGVPAGRWDDIHKLCRQRALELLDAASELEDALQDDSF